MSRLEPLRLTRVKGVWTTQDGMTTIGPAQGITMCENAHPMRWKDERGIKRTGYCPGGEEHDYTKGWDIQGDLHGLPDNAYGTFREARDALIGAIQKERCPMATSPERS